MSDDFASGGIVQGKPILLREGDCVMPVRKMSDFAAWLRGETDEVHLYTPQEIAALDGLARVNAEAIEAAFQDGLRRWTPGDFLAD